MRSEGVVQIVDCGRYGLALAWVRPGRPTEIRELEMIERTGGMRVVKAREDLQERVRLALRRA